MKITKYAIACWVVGIIFILFGTTTKRYYFEALAILMFLFGYILADWVNLTSKNKPKKKKEERENV